MAAAALEILDPTGHMTLEWDPDDKEQVAKAKAEFDRLASCGFAFFTAPARKGDKRRKVAKFTKTPGKLRAEMGELPEQTKEFKERDRTVAVPPMRGG